MGAYLRALKKTRMNKMRVQVRTPDDWIEFRTIREAREWIEQNKEMLFSVEYAEQNNLVVYDDEFDALGIWRPDGPGEDDENPWAEEEMTYGEWRKKYGFKTKTEIEEERIKNGQEKKKIMLEEATSTMEKIKPIIDASFESRGIPTSISYIRGEIDSIGARIYFKLTNPVDENELLEVIRSIFNFNFDLKEYDGGYFIDTEVKSWDMVENSI